MTMGSWPKVPNQWVQIREVPEISRKIFCVDALEKCGKTRFALTCPEPIYMHGFDVGEEGTIDEFIEAGKTIFHAKYDVPNPTADVAATTTAARTVHTQFVSDFYDALASQGGGTIIIDTHTEQNALMRLAYFGKLTQVMPHHYGPPNTEMASLINAVYRSDKNLMLVRKMRKKYVNDNWNGEYEPAGWNDAGFKVQGTVQLWKDAGGFHCQIMDSRHNPWAEGKQLANAEINWNSVVDLINNSVAPPRVMPPTNSTAAMPPIPA